MAVTKAKIEKLARALFPRYGIKDVGSLVATIVKYRNNDGYAAIGRPEGGWSWFASRASTVATPSRVTLSFPADYRRDAEQAREDLYRQLENASFSVMSEDEVEAAMKSKPGTAASARSVAPLPKKTPPAQLDREIAEVLAKADIKPISESSYLGGLRYKTETYGPGGTRSITEVVSPPSRDLGMARAEHLAEALRGLGHEAEAFRQHGQWNAVGVHRVEPGTAGTWRHVVSFTDGGLLVPFAGGGRGNPWRGGPEHNAVEEAARWHP
jgi:hypothetical protein